MCYSICLMHSQQLTKPCSFSLTEELHQASLNSHSLKQEKENPNPHHLFLTKRYAGRYPRGEMDLLPVFFFLLTDESGD